MNANPEKHRREPEWLLTDRWGIGCDTRNWMLMWREGKHWKNIAYYATVDALLQGFHQKYVRTMDKSGETLVEHVGKASQDVAKAIERLHSTMGPPPPLDYSLQYAALGGDDER